VLVCRYILENGQVSIYSSSYSYSADKIEFSETEEREKSVICYTLEKTGTATTRLTLEIHENKSMSSQIIFKLIWKKKLEEIFNKSLQNLTRLVKEIKLLVGAL
jgi:hypothetical protein